MSPTQTAARAIEQLVRDGHTVRDLERALGLSHGYLSKVRHGSVAASPPLVALLEILRLHPAALATVRATTGAPETPHRAPRARRQVDPSAWSTLRLLAPRFATAGVRFAVSGDAALRLWVPDAPERPGVDLVVDPRDRHVLALARDAGHRISHHPPDLAVVRLRTSVPNESLRLWFPSGPPLAGAIADATELDGLPVIDLTTLTLANLLSQREGAADAAAIGIRAGASVTDLAARLERLERLPERRSPYVLRSFDRRLARRRLEGAG